MAPGAGQLYGWTFRDPVACPAIWLQFWVLSRTNMGTVLGRLPRTKSTRRRGRQNIRLQLLHLDLYLKECALFVLPVPS